MIHKKATVVGAGILGLATARTLSKLGYQVTVIEKSFKAKGSSIRNFGMIWPIGQHIHEHYQRSLKSREIWLEICKNGKIWNNQCGSVQLFTNKIELDLALDFFEKNINARPSLKLLSKKECRDLVPNMNELNVVGGLYSSTEVIVESRMAIREIPKVLEAQNSIQFIWGKTVIHATNEKTITSDGAVYENDIVFICGGFEISILFPEVFQKAPITISQLNMIRSTPIDIQIPAVCGGLSFLHYNAYADIENLNQYEEFCLEKYPNQLKHGIHLLVSQNHENCLTIGDSHEYNLHNDPFQENIVNEYILDYYNELFSNHNLQISQHWMGEYLKMTNGKSEWVQEIQTGVFIMNGPGGAGMTLGFGMAEEIIPTLLN